MHLGTSKGKAIDSTLVAFTVKKGGKNISFSSIEKKYSRLDARACWVTAQYSIIHSAS